jgi:hypothetical protein
VKYFSRFIISLNDLYGRALSGAMLTITTYLLLCLRLDSDYIQVTVSGFYESSKAIFAITFLLVSFLVGHIPLGLSFLCFSYIRRPPSLRDVLSSGFDPTINNQMTELFSRQFSDSAMKARDWSVLSYCKGFLQCNYPDLHRSLLENEAHANLYAGVIFPLLYAAMVLAVSESFIWSAVLVGASVWFVRSFVRSVGEEARSIIRLYYHAVSRDESEEVG